MYNYVLFLFASGALSPLNCPGLLEPAPVCTPSFTSDLLCSVLSLVTGEKEGGRRIQEMEQSRIGGQGYMLSCLGGSTGTASA